MPRASSSPAHKLPPLPLPLPPTTHLLRKNAQLPSSPPQMPANTASHRRTRTNTTKSAQTSALLPLAPPPHAKGPLGKSKALRHTARRPWSPEEDALLLRGLQLHGDAPNKWILVAEMVPGRSRLQVKSRARRLLPDVYGDKHQRQRRPSATPSASHTASELGSEQELDLSSHDDWSDDGIEVDDVGVVDADAQEEIRSSSSLDRSTVSPRNDPPMLEISGRSPPATEKRPRRISAYRKSTTIKDLPPLPTSPPLLSPPFGPPLPPLPTSLPPLSPSLITTVTPQRLSTASKRSRTSTATPTSSHSSLSSAPPSPPPPTKLAKPNLFDPFTLLQPQIPPNSPYTVHISALALALMDMHAHLLQTEVIGLFGGTFDSASRTLRIQDTYPCDTPTLSSSIQCEMDPVAETRARQLFAERGLGVVGWYHSHPTFDAWPSVRDVENQGVYQRLFSTTGHGPADSECIEPFVGAIVTPYHADQTTLVSDVAFYYVGGEAHSVPYRIDEVRDQAHDGAPPVQALEIFDGFCEHHLSELQHLAKEYHGWKRFAKMKHSVRSHSGLDLDALVDQFMVKVLGPELLVDQGHGAERLNDDDEGEVDV